MLCRSVQRRRPGPAPRVAARYSPPLGRRPAPPAPARIWPRLAHMPPRRSGPGNRPIPAPRAHTARFPRPARTRRRGPAPPSVCLRPAPPAPLAWLRVCPPATAAQARRAPRPSPRHSRPVPRRPPGPERRCAAAARPEGAVPPRGDQIPKSGALETAAPSRVNFREIRGWGFWPKKQKSEVVNKNWTRRG